MTLDTKGSNVPHIHVTAMLKTQISVCFDLRWAVSELQVIMRQVHWLTPKWHWALKGHPMYMWQLLQSQISFRFALRTAPFELQAILRQVHWMTPNDVKRWKVKDTPHTCYNYPRLPNFSLFRPSSSRFRVSGHYETSAPNDPKITLSTKRSKVPHLHVTTIPESYILLRFTLRLAISKIF